MKPFIFLLSQLFLNFYIRVTQHSGTVAILCISSTELVIYLKICRLRIYDNVLFVVLFICIIFKCIKELTISQLSWFDKQYSL